VELAGVPPTEGPSLVSFNPAHVTAVVEVPGHPDRTVLWLNPQGAVTIAERPHVVRSNFEPYWPQAVL
jgi:hypothetical protein